MEIVLKALSISIIILIYISLSGLVAKEKLDFFGNMNSYLVGFLVQVVAIMMTTFIPNFFHLSWSIVNGSIWIIILVTFFIIIKNYKIVIFKLQKLYNEKNNVQVSIAIFLFLFIFCTEIFIANGQKLSYDGGFWLPTYTNNIGIDQINSFVPYSGEFSLTFFKNYVFNSYSLVNSFLIANTGLNVMNTTGIIIPAIIGALYVAIIFYMENVLKTEKTVRYSIVIFIFLVSYFSNNWNLSWIQLNMFLGSAIVYVLLPMMTGSELVNLFKSVEKNDTKNIAIRLSLISIFGVFFTTTSIYIGGYMLGITFIMMLFLRKHRSKLLYILIPIAVYLFFAIMSLVSTAIIMLLFT